jgi:hypothetical protein
MCCLEVHDGKKYALYNRLYGFLLDMPLPTFGNSRIINVLAGIEAARACYLF